MKKKSGKSSFWVELFLRVIYVNVLRALLFYTEMRVYTLIFCVKSFAQNLDLIISQNLCVKSALFLLCGFFQVFGLKA